MCIRGVISSSVTACEWVLFVTDQTCIIAAPQICPACDVQAGFSGRGGGRFRKSADAYHPCPSTYTLSTKAEETSSPCRTRPPAFQLDVIEVELIVGARAELPPGSAERHSAERVRYPSHLWKRYAMMLGKRIAALSFLLTYLTVEPAGPKMLERTSSSVCPGTISCVTMLQSVCGVKN